MEQTPPISLRGICSDYKSPVEYNAGHMKGVFVPSSSPYDVSSSARSQTSAMGGDGGAAENHPLIGGSMDSVENKLVLDSALFTEVTCIPMFPC